MSSASFASTRRLVSSSSAARWKTDDPGQQEGGAHLSALAPRVVPTVDESGGLRPYPEVAGERQAVPSTSRNPVDGGDDGLGEGLQQLRDTSDPAQNQKVVLNASQIAGDP